MLRRVLMRVHRENIGDARQIFRPLIERDGRKLIDLSFVRRDIFRRAAKINRGFQSGLLHRQAIVILVDARFRIGQQDNIMGLAYG